MSFRKLAFGCQLVVRVRILVCHNILLILLTIVLILDPRCASVYVRDAVAAMTVVSGLRRFEVLVVVGRGGTGERTAHCC